MMFDHERTSERAVTQPPSDDLSIDPAELLAPEPSHPVAPTPPSARLPWRRELPPRLRQRAVIATVAILATALVAGLFAWNGGRAVNDVLADASHAPSSDPGAASNPSPSDRPGPSPSTGPAPSYEPLTGSAVAPIAILTARGARGVIVPLDSGFRLESTDGTPASTLASRLSVDPAFSFSVAKEAGDHAVLLAPAQPLHAGTVYQFALRGGAGQLLDTWAFQAKQPLRVIGTLPGTRTAEVPLDTGIEVTFDQDGIVDAAAHVSVEPATNGRFEQHGRTLAFIPDRPLRASTLYSVTVSRGVAVTGTGEATVVDTRFQFETAAKATPSEDALTYAFSDAVIESATAERPIIAIWTFGGGESKPPATTKITVDRLAGLDAAIAAFRLIRARPDWTRWSTAGLVDVSKLRRVVSADLPLRPYQNSFFIQLPDRLAAGWYLVQQTDGSQPIQTVLQVTDVAGYLAVSETKTIVWANDLRTRGPIVGATASTEGVRFARTDARGLATGTTPKILLPIDGATCAHPCDPVVVVRAPDGRRVFLPAATGHDKLEGYGGNFWWYEADPQTWSILHTDRSRYSPGATVNLWGFTRDRDNGSIPASVTVDLYAESSDFVEGAPAVASLTRHPSTTGAFTGSLPLTGLPDGYYTMTLSIGHRVIRSTSIVVGPIAKPAYHLEVTTGRRIYINGDRVRVTVDARFFEGTPVPGVPLRLDGFAEGTATTDTLGTAVWRTTALTEPGQEGPNSTSIQAMPARAEEGEISGNSREIVVFPSSRTIDAVSRIARGRVIVTGGVHLVDVNRLEAAVARGQSIWELDHRGRAVRGATVTVRFSELIPSRRKVGTQYDFVEKKVVPIYVVDVKERIVATIRVKTAADGSWRASVPASVADHSYAILATVGDPDGHVARVSSWASRTTRDPYETSARASLDATSPTANRDGQFSLGERIDIKLTDPERRQAGGDGTRYLFFTTQRGIHGATVQSSSRYVTRFPSWGAPNLSIGGVRFTGEGYVGTVWFAADFHILDRRLQVDVTSGAARYAPGQTATVRVRTRAANGAPVPATVVLRAIDEKLFAIGAAGAEDPLTELYAGIGSGVFGTYRSHRDPEGQPEGGDTTGGGGDDRDDFRDSLLFEAITTGPDGWGSATFKVSDDLTSWRVTAAAVTSRLQAGVGSVLVPVGLPFFVDASIASEYLSADRPTIAVRTFGSAVSAGTPVTVQVTSATLAFDSGPLPASAFANIDVPLPALHVGKHTVTISATTGSGSSARTDRLTRTFSVVDTRLTRQRTAYVELPSSGAFAGGDGFTTVLVADASGGRYLSLLTELAAGGGARLDRALAADLASTLLKDRFGADGSDTTAEPFVVERYQGLDDGLALVPYGSSDLELSALVAIVAPERVDRMKLSFYLTTIRETDSETRERRMFALAGLAGLGESVLPAIRTAAADSALTVREQLMLGLGAAALGDSATARTLLSTVVAATGEQAGTLARLRVGTTAADITAGTALAAALAAAVGDPLAARLWAYVEANPAAARIEVLPAIAFVTRTLDHLPVQPARFAWTVAGTRHVVDLGKGQSFRLELTASQLATLTIDRLAGTVGVTTEWRQTVKPAAFHADPDVTIARSINPSGSVKSSDLVVVDLLVTFKKQAGTGCRQVTELVPSGLAPVGSSSRWFDPQNDEPLPDDGLILPYDQSGSRVFFCVEPSTKRTSFTLRYVARVVTPGTYVWEPAVAQSGTAEDIANLTPATSITIQ